MQVELLEGELQEEARRLGCVAATVVVGMESESDLALPVQAAQVEEGAVADQLEVALSTTARLRFSRSARIAVWPIFRSNEARTSSSLIGPE